MERDRQVKHDADRDARRLAEREAGRRTEVPRDDGHKVARGRPSDAPPKV
jgi:hypothetical protein